MCSPLLRQQSKVSSIAKLKLIKIVLLVQFDTFLRVVPVFMAKATFKVLSEPVRLKPRIRTYMRRSPVISDRNYKRDRIITFNKEHVSLPRDMKGMKYMSRQGR